MIFYPAISRKVPRKKLMSILLKVALIGYAVMLLPGVLLQSGTMKVLGMDLKFLLITIGYMLANFGQYGYYLILMISVINTVEYNEYIHGTRDEGIITSMRPFLTRSPPWRTRPPPGTSPRRTSFLRYTSSSRA